MSLRIRNVVRTTNDPRGEYVEIINNGTRPVRLTGLKLTDFTRTQRPFTCSPSLAPGQAAR